MEFLKSVVWRQHADHLKFINEKFLGFNLSNELIEATEEVDHIPFQGERVNPFIHHCKYSHEEIPHEIDTLPGVIVMTLLNILFDRAITFIVVDIASIL